MKMLFQIWLVLNFVCYCKMFTGFNTAKLDLSLPNREAKHPVFSSISPEVMKFFSLKVGETMKETLPEFCLQSCKNKEGCIRAIHCLNKEPCQPGTLCTDGSFNTGTCYLMGNEGTELEPRTYCKVSQPGRVQIVLEENSNTGSDVSFTVLDTNTFQRLPNLILPPALQAKKAVSSEEKAGAANRSEEKTGTPNPSEEKAGELNPSEENQEKEIPSEESIPLGCQTEPSSLNLGAVKKQTSQRPGYPVVIEYECGQQGQSTYKYVSGTTEATCDDDGHWTLPALLCVPTNCYYQQRNGRGLLKAWYAGSVSRTKNDIECQMWTSNSPHDHAFKKKRRSLYPADGGPEHNRCRDIDGEKAPWCYTTDRNVRWAFCQVPLCENEEAPCRIPPYVPGTRSIRTETEEGSVHVTYQCLEGLTSDGGNTRATCNKMTGIWTWPNMMCYSTECYYYDDEMTGKAVYKGTLTTTTSGRTCQRFDSQSPHEHTNSDEISDFPGETSLEDIGNQCRDGDGEAAPWCYTTDPQTRWEYCDVPECKFDLMENRLLPSS